MINDAVRMRIEAREDTYPLFAIGLYRYYDQ